MTRLSFLLAFLISFQFQAREIEVCQSCEINSVKAAVALAESGDVILIQGGTYKEHDIKIVNKSLRIIGKDYPVIDAELKGSAFSIQADNVSIEGLKITNIGKSYTREYAAILMAHSRNFKFLNNQLENIFFGFLIERSSEGIISGNRITSSAKTQDNSGNGIHLYHSKNVEVTNNEVSGTRDGIYLEFSGNCVISNNVSRNNLRYGLHFMFSDHNNYIENLFERNGAGVAVMFSKHIQMHRNIFRKNWGTASYGLLLKEISDAELKHNIFEDNTIAINADGTNRINYVENDFINNGYAVKIRGGCYENIFSRNNFLYNSFDVSYAGRLNENEFRNNYWSEYSGYDLDKNGIGDVPYRPVQLFSYLVNQTPESIVLLRSLFIDMIDFSEKVSPIFTPAELIDVNPQMKKIQW